MPAEPLEGFLPSNALKFFKFHGNAFAKAFVQQTLIQKKTQGKLFRLLLRFLVLLQ